METAKEKCKIIEEMISRDNNLLNISKLCKVADVSRSGFYSWRKNKDKREAKEEKDRNDFELILEAYRYRGFDKGARSIHMRLLHTGVRMNIKKSIFTVLFAHVFIIIQSCIFKPFVDIIIFQM